MRHPQLLQKVYDLFHESRPCDQKRKYEQWDYKHSIPFHSEQNCKCYNADVTGSFILNERTKNPTIQRSNTSKKSPKMDSQFDIQRKQKKENNTSVPSGLIRSFRLWISQSFTRPVFTIQKRKIPTGMVMPNRRKKEIDAMPIQLTQTEMHRQRQVPSTPSWVRIYEKQMLRAWSSFQIFLAATLTLERSNASSSNFPHPRTTAVCGSSVTQTGIFV